MFGKRRVPFGGKPKAEPPIPPGGGAEPYPIERMDAALDGAIRLFTRALDLAGIDMGSLAIRGSVPADVIQQLTDCTSFRGGEDGSPTYLVLGVTRDFKAMMYPPHCQMFLIVNSAGICEDSSEGLLASLAPMQLPQPLVQAHVMRRWIRFILPTGRAMKDGEAGLVRLHQQLSAEINDVLSQIPNKLAAQIGPANIAEEWCWGFPAVYTQPLTAETERMNNLPVTGFIAQTLTNFLADMQMRGLQEQRRA
jgi:hypothetical protein